MPAIFDLTGPDPEALASAASALDHGELVVLPTDTVYGLAARADVPGATARLFEAKRRPRDLTLPVLVGDAVQAEGIGVFDERARALANAFWPGPLTLIVPRAGGSRAWDLGAEPDSIGLRVPDHHVALALLHRTGPLPASSANRSSAPTPEDCAGVRAALGDAVAVYLCAGRLSPVPSTVVDLTGAEPTVLRKGALPASEVLDALR